MRVVRIVSLLLASFMFGLLATGCGAGGPKLHPVRGTVSAKGKPAAHALVFMHRKGRAGPNEPVPYGRAGEDGAFKITTTSDGDGAAAGDYVITVVWPDMTKQPDGNGERPDVLAGTYASAASSQLTAQVKEGDNVLPALTITPPATPAKAVRDPNNK